MDFHEFLIILQGEDHLHIYRVFAEWRDEPQVCELCRAPSVWRYVPQLPFQAKRETAHRCQQCIEHEWNSASPLTSQLEEGEFYMLAPRYS